MGSGKGAPEGWVAVIKPGRVLFEMGGVSEAIAREAMRLASHKLPIETKFIIRETATGVVDELSAEEAAQVIDGGRRQWRSLKPSRSVSICAA